MALAGTQIWWTTEVNIAFNRMEEGYENALKDYYKKQVIANALSFGHSPVLLLWPNLFLYFWKRSGLAKSDPAPMQTLHNLCLGNSYMYEIKDHMLAWKKADGTS